MPWPFYCVSITLYINTGNWYCPNWIIHWFTKIYKLQCLQKVVKGCNGCETVKWMLVTDVGDGCWWPNMLVRSLRCWWPISFTEKRRFSQSEISLHHKVTNITMSPTSLSPCKTFDCKKLFSFLCFGDRFPYSVSFEFYFFSISQTAMPQWFYSKSLTVRLWKFQWIHLPIHMINSPGKELWA